MLVRAWLVGIWLVLLGLGLVALAFWIGGIRFRVGWFKVCRWGLVLG